MRRPEPARNATRPRHGTSMDSEAAMTSAMVGGVTDRVEGP